MRNRRPSRFSSRAAVAGVLLLILAACLPQRPAPPIQPASPSARPPAIAHPTAAAPPAAPAPVASPALAASPAPTVGVPPTPAGKTADPFFGPPWAERSLYRRNLTPGEAGILETSRSSSEYRIGLTIGDTLTDLQGRQQVRYTNQEREPLAEIYMRLFPNALGGEMTVSSVTADGQPVPAEAGFGDTALRLSLPAPLSAGDATVIDLSYRIRVPEGLNTGYGLLSYTDGILALDTPYAPIPVYDDDGWNVEEPPANSDTSFYDASYYLVRVTAPSSLLLAAAGVEVDRAVDGATQTVTFAHGPARDFFLAASSAYDVTSQQLDGLLVRSFAPDAGRAGARIALDTAGAAVRIFSARFGPYPYGELDLAATPMLALGIEYPGIIGISSEIYEGDSPNETLIETTVAHEVAHQWFYGLVGNDQVDEPWLDEALAQYATWLYYVDRYGVVAAERVREGWISRWERVDREEMPVGLPAAAYAGREYGAIVYGRGPLFVSALAERMGQDVFDRFLKGYSARYRWGIASARDFKAMASAACSCSLEDLYAAWLDP